METESNMMSAMFGIDSPERNPMPPLQGFLEVRNVSAMV